MPPGGGPSSGAHDDCPYFEGVRPTTLPRLSAGRVSVPGLSRLAYERPHLSYRNTELSQRSSTLLSSWRCAVGVHQGVVPVEDRDVVTVPSERPARLALMQDEVVRCGSVGRDPHVRAEAAQLLHDFNRLWLGRTAYAAPPGIPRPAEARHGRSFHKDGDHRCLRGVILSGDDDRSDSEDNEKNSKQF